MNVFSIRVSEPETRSLTVDVLAEDEESAMGLALDAAMEREDWEYQSDGAYQYDVVGVSPFFAGANEASDDDLDALFEVTSIGSVSNGIDGADFYAMVKRKDGEFLSKDLAYRFYMGKVFIEGNGPGAVFCNMVRVMKEGLPHHSCLCVAEKRRDI